MDVKLRCDLPLWWLGWNLHERVCLMVGKRRRDGVVINRFVPVRNAAHNRREHYAVSVEDYMRVCSKLEQGEKVVGAIHSHPRCFEEFPSEDDVAGLPPDWIGAVYALATGGLTWFRPEPQPASRRSR